MTEVPEHLLKKAAEARARREAAAGPGAPADSGAATATAEPEPEEQVAEPDVKAEEALEELRDALGDKIIGSHIEPHRGLWIRVDAADWRDAARAARDRLDCRFFDWLSCIDWMPSPYGRELEAEQDPEEPKDPEPMEWGYTGGSTRFQMICRVHSTTRHIGVIIKADLDDAAPSIDSLIPVYAGANWHEREAIEMFGIGVREHPDVRNIYLPGGFEGYPLRKDYPLLARRMKPWPGIVDVELMPGEDT